MTEPDTSETKPKRQYIRGLRKIAVLHDIARGDRYQDIADRYGVHYQRICQIEHDNRPEIARMREQVNQQKEEELIDLWIADKRKRLATLQGLTDYANDLLEDGDFAGAAEFSKSADKIMKALHNAAEELEQLPTRYKIALPEPEPEPIVDVRRFEDGSSVETHFYGDRPTVYVEKNPRGDVVRSFNAVEEFSSWGNLPPERRPLGETARIIGDLDSRHMHEMCFHFGGYQGCTERSSTP